MNSDFDALVIVADHEQFHDTSIVDGVPLDVFVYPLAYFNEEYECEDFVQIHDGRIITDYNGIGKKATSEDSSLFMGPFGKIQRRDQAGVDWCVKMFERAKRGDCEGMFRWHLGVDRQFGDLL
ncbi:MAG: hypothetical protein ACLTS6_21815 [Anaerobutyricum sp.]